MSRPSLRIALAQFDFTVGAVEKNAERIIAFIEEARDEYGADLVLFPSWRSAAIRRKTCCCARVSSPIASARCNSWRRGAGHRRRGRLAAERRRGGLQRGQRAARRRGRRPYRKRELPNTPCSTSAAISAWIPMAARACSTWPACRSGW
jgi:NAD+ synthase (glutamine-hydrolysing)